MNKLTVDGKEKEIKFIEVHEKDRVVKIFFKDFTFITLEDVKIFNKDKDFTI